MHNEEPTPTDAAAASPATPAKPDARTTEPLLWLAAEPDLACTDAACLPADLQPS